MKPILYKGFSTQKYRIDKSFAVADMDTVKMDLLNHLYTSKGSRVMMPAFGTRIPDLPFEPLDPVTISVFEEDIRSVINFDPRVELINMEITPSPDTNSMTATVTLLFVELNLVGNMDINIIFESA